MPMSNSKGKRLEQEIMPRIVMSSVSLGVRSDHPPNFRRLNATDIHFEDTNSETKLHGWLMSNVSESSDESPLNVLYYHGSGRNIAVQYRVQRYEILLSFGNVRLFVYDYPGACGNALLYFIQCSDSLIPPTKYLLQVMVRAKELLRRAVSQVLHRQPIRSL